MILDQIDCVPAVDEEAPGKIEHGYDIEETEEYLESFNSELNGIREKQRQLQQEVLKLEDLRRRLSKKQNVLPELLGRSSQLIETRLGSVPPENRSVLEERLSGTASVIIPLQEEEQTLVALITLKRSSSEVSAILRELGWEDYEAPADEFEPSEEALASMGKKIAGLKTEQRKLARKGEERIEDERERLLAEWKSLRLNELYSVIEENYGRTASTVLFTGWVPKKKRVVLEDTIRGASEHKCYIEWHSPQDAVGIPGSEAPVKFTNPKILSPFQMLVENYSVPEYGSFDPTPVVALTYLLMFGLMFADVGHGLVLLAGGIFGALCLRGRSIARLFQLVVWCGCSSVLFGALFGSYFGMEWLPPLWFNYHEVVAGHAEGGFVTDIYGILTITIYFGIAVIGIGLLINWVNLVRKKRWLPLLLEKTGLLGGWIYGAGVYTAFYFAAHEFKALPPGSFLFFMLGLPSLLLIIKPVYGYVAGGGTHGGGEKEFSPLTIVDCIMEWVVEMLEIFSGYLANTLSFMRVAGLGIAHVSLMTAFFEIAAMASDGGGYGIGSILILILGNLLVILLEGLSAGIQALRLNYYEFFSKYFSGSGTAYLPVSLR
jgi:V/A-type H+-transporting ATPase subunit I